MEQSTLAEARRQRNASFIHASNCAVRPRSHARRYRYPSSYTCATPTLRQVSRRKVRHREIEDIVGISNPDGITDHQCTADEGAQQAAWRTR